MRIDIDVNIAKEMLDAGDAVMLDTRSFEQFSKETIIGTKNMEAPSLESLEQFAGKKIIFHCNKGGGSGRKANAICDTLPFDIYNLAGGIAAWKEAGLEVCCGSSDDVINTGESDIKSCAV